MGRSEGGAFRTTIVVPVGGRYRFRSVLDGDRGVSAAAADEYVPNGFGEDGSVVRTDDVGE